MPDSSNWNSKMKFKNRLPISEILNGEISFRGPSAMSKKYSEKNICEYHKVKDALSGLE